MAGDNIIIISEFDIELYNKNEKLVRTGKLESGKIRIDSENLQLGTYFLKILTVKEFFNKQVIVK